MKKIITAGILLLAICLSKAEAQVSVRVVRPIVYRAPYRTVAVVKPAPVVVVRPDPIVVAAPPVVVRPMPRRVVVVRPAPVVAVVRPVRVVYYR